MGYVATSSFGFLTAHTSFLTALLATALVMLLSVPVLCLGRHPAAAPAAAEEPAPPVPAETPGAKS
jgi:hypothetical protein